MPPPSTPTTTTTIPIQIPSSHPAAAALAHQSTIHPPRRLLIFQEARNPQNHAELVYLPVNKQGLPITGPGPELPSILELPLRILRAFTEIFNLPKYSGWSILSAGPYHDTSEEGKFYAVVLEYVGSRDGQVVG